MDHQLPSHQSLAASSVTPAIYMSVLFHYIHEPPLSSSSFPPACQLRHQNPLPIIPTIPPLKMAKPSPPYLSMFCLQTPQHELILSILFNPNENPPPPKHTSYQVSPSLSLLLLTYYKSPLTLVSIQSTLPALSSPNTYFLISTNIFI